MADAALNAERREVHPRGLWVIVFTEAWERFSFYGMQALLVLYMTSYLLQPQNAGKVAQLGPFRQFIFAIFGQLSIQAFASQLFGLYVGLVYFLPVIGGWLGDRLIGRVRAVIIGALLMAAGHFLMAFEFSFLYALACLIVGSGFLKGNLAAQVGGLYPRDDPRRDRGYSLYVLAINVGAFIAPLVCGTLGERVGWHFGFGAAGVGMLIGLTVYLSGLRYLPADRVRGIPPEERPHLVPGDGRAIAAVVAMLALTALYWTAQSQVWNTYPVWAKTHVNRMFGSFEIPVTWFQSLDSLTVLVFAPLVLWHWKQQARRQTEPGDIAKIAIGSAIFAGACLLLTLGQWLAGSGKVALVWPVAFHAVSAFGYLYLGPIALALTSRAAPPPVNAALVGSYYLSIFAGGIFSGWLGRFYEQMNPAMFWAMHAAIVGTGAVLFILLNAPLASAMRLSEADVAQT